MDALITVTGVIIVIALLYAAKKRKSIRGNSVNISPKNKYNVGGEIKIAQNSFNMETAKEFSGLASEENLDDEYKAEETYSVKDVPYKENNEFEPNEYIEKTVAGELSSLEKGIIFAEILDKPVSLRRKM